MRTFVIVTAQRAVLSALSLAAFQSVAMSHVIAWSKRRATPLPGVGIDRRDPLSVRPKPIILIFTLIRWESGWVQHATGEPGLKCIAFNPGIDEKSQLYKAAGDSEGQNAIYDSGT